MAKTKQTQDEPVNETVVADNGWDEAVAELGGDEAAKSSRIGTIKFYNPYTGNDDLIVKGGFGQSVAQKYVDVADIFPIGPKGKMSPYGGGGAYEAYVAKSIEVQVVGWSPTFSLIDEKAYLEANGVTLTDKKYFPAISKNWVDLTVADNRAASGKKSVCNTVRYLYVTLKGDPNKVLYAMPFKSTATKGLNALITALEKLKMDYTFAYEKAKGVKGAIPFPYAFNVVLGVGDYDDKVTTVRHITLEWKNGYPKTLEDFLKIRVSIDEYKKNKELRDALDEFLTSPNAPHVPKRALLPLFTEMTGYALNAEGTMVDARLLPAPQKTNVLAAGKPDKVLLKDWMKQNNGTEDSLLEHLSAKTGKSKMKVSEAINDLDLTLSDLINGNGSNVEPQTISDMVAFINS